jgi:RNA polymerase sigma-70 factor (sigma-E family)
MTTAERNDEFQAYVLAERADLLRTATLLCAGDQHLAEDLVQSMLTRLYVAWPSFKKARSPGGYARQALVNALIDEKRRPWRRERSLGVLPELAEPSPSTGSRVDDLNQAMRLLPPRMRAAVVFRYFHHLSVAETAEALGCREGTVKSQTARALDRLREALEPTAPVQPVPGLTVARAANGMYRSTPKPFKPINRLATTTSRSY